MSLRAEYAYMPEPNRKNLFWFGISMGIALPLLSLCLWFGIGLFPQSPVAAKILVLPAIAFLLCSFIAPMKLRIPYIGWMYAALTMGYFVIRILLTLIYFGVITPFAFFMRLGGRDPLNLKKQGDGQSFWIEREPLARDHFERQF